MQVGTHFKPFSKASNAELEQVFAEKIKSSLF